MNTFKVDLSPEFESIDILAIADTHIGDPHSDRERILSDIEYVRSHENAFCILNGDIMNCAIKTSVSDSYSETMSPMDELSICEEIFAPIAAKTICVVPGNHEERHYRSNGIDVTRLMCKQLGIENRYSPTVAFVFLRFGRDAGNNRHHSPILYTLYVTHGNGGGRKDGGKIQRLADYATIVDADIYVAGHTHLEAAFKKSFCRPHPAKNSITYGTHLFVNTSASLDYGGYGARGGFEPACKDRPIIHLNGTKKEMSVSI